MRNECVVSEIAATRAGRSDAARAAFHLEARWFCGAILAVAGLSCVLAACFPLGVSILTVFLFAGPHNWAEARYFLARMPARWGPLRSYFLTGIAGVLLLTSSFAALPALAGTFAWDEEIWLMALGMWNTALVAWIVVLTRMRARQNPRRDWELVFPIGFGLIALNWFWPVAWDLGLVYAHPLLALWFLDREIARSMPRWSTAFRKCLAVLPLMLIALWWHLWEAPALPGDDALTLRITAHAGAGVFTGVSPHLLISTHVFLEMIHYAVWLIAVPQFALRMGRWRVAAIPLARRSNVWRRGIVGVLCIGGCMTFVLWGGFLVDYPLTRDIYFTVALLHVLAEVPFLLRLL